MNRFIKALDRILETALITLAAVMVITVSWQVISRYGLRTPSSLTEEIARFQLIWMGLLGAAYTFRKRMHVGIDIMVARLKGPSRKIIETISLSACILFALSILMMGGIELMRVTHELNQTAAATGWRMSFIYSIIPLSGLLWVIYGVYFLINLWSSDGSDDDPDPVTGLMNRDA